MVIVDISQIVGRDGESQPISIVVDCHDIGETDPWFTGDISVSGQIVNVGESLRLVFQVSGKATMECSRCLKKIEEMIDFNVDDAIEAEDIDLVNGYLDIGEIIQTALIFYRPMQPLCDESCKGLCPQCGVDRNHSECECDKTLIDPRFAVLGNLLEK